MILWCFTFKSSSFSDEPTQNDHLNLKIPSALQGFIEFQLFVYLSSHNFTLATLFYIFGRRQLFSAKKL